MTSQSALNDNAALHVRLRKRNGSVNFAMRSVIDLNGHNVEFVFFSRL